MFQVTFPEIARVLETLSATIPAAEGHGCLCGALCTTLHYPLDRWLDEIIPDVDDASEGDRRVLNLLFTDTLNALRGDQMEFEPCSLTTRRRSSDVQPRCRSGVRDSCMVSAPAGRAMRATCPLTWRRFCAT